MSAARQPIDNPQALPSERLLSPQEYLQQERFAPERSEYVRGDVHPMGGSTSTHSVLCACIVGELHGRLKCRPFCTCSCQMRTLAGQGDVYFYPDISVVSGRAVLQEGTNDVLTNPVLVVEIQSPHPTRYNKNAKFADYARILSLTDHLLISTDRPGVRHYARQDNGQWLVTFYADPDAAVASPTLEMELPLSEIYDRVQWETPS